MRSQLSRAEVQGILSLYYGSPRYDTHALQVFLEGGAMNAVIKGTAGELVIPLDAEMVATIAARMNEPRLAARQG